MKTDYGAANKIIVITGVSRGLGRAMTERFISLGHTVLGCARSGEEIKKLRKLFGKPHDFDTVDIASDAAVKVWAERLLKAHPAPDFLINNAALINKNAPLWEISADEFSRVIDVNIKGTANTIRHYIPAMVKQGRGVIVNFSSGWGRSVDAEVAPYCATKFAIEGLTQALALELPSGMCAVPLNPGIIDTAMLQSCFGGSSSSYESPAEWAERAVPYILSFGPKQNGQSLTVLSSAEVAKLLPEKRPGLGDIQTAAAKMKSRRNVLNPPGKPRLHIKDLITKGRP